MKKISSSLIWAVAILLLGAGCKKDLLHVNNVYKLSSGTTDGLNRIHFIDDKICYVAGGVMFDKATVLRSEDGGYTWAVRSFPAAGKEMFCFDVSSTGHMYMCGIDGTVLHSADTGKNWRVGRIFNWQQYVGLSFPVPDTGVFVSTILQRGGSIVQVDTAFNIISEDSVEFGINNIYMTSSSTGYVIGYGTVMKTTNYRKSWVFQDVKGDNFTAMDIHGDEIWMCGANGGIYHTTNGGTSWERLRNGNSLALPRFMLRDILFTTSQTGWAVGDDGLLIFSENGGRDWVEYENFTKSALRSIVQCPNGDLLIAGDNGEVYRIVL